jgi:hypothetical protein
VEIIVTSPWVPVEWIAAHGFMPRGVWSLAGATSGAVAEGVCAFAHGARCLAETQPQTPVIFTTACDQMRRAADAFQPSAAGRSFLFNLPATWQSPAARRLYHAEVERLGKFLQPLGGKAPTSGGLAAAIHRYEATRARLWQVVEGESARDTARALACLWGGTTLARSAAVPAAGAGGVSPPEAVPGGTPGKPAGEDACATAPAAQLHRVALALVGGPLTASQWGLFDLIESAGGCVVLNATEPGERCLLPPLPGLDVAQVSQPAVSPTSRSAALGLPGVAPTVDGHAGLETCDRADSEVCATNSAAAPLARLCDHYFDHIVDVFQRPNSRLYDWLRPRLAERRVRGIVLWVHVGCDLWRAEAASLREAFGLPVLVLDTTETRGAGLRELSRLGAFIESLQSSLQPFVAPATKGCGGTVSALPR